MNYVKKWHPKGCTKKCAFVKCDEFKIYKNGFWLLGFNFIFQGDESTEDRISFEISIL